MPNDRFIRLLTSELCDELTETERAELDLLLQENEEFRTQRTLFREYWEHEKGEYQANAAMFKKVLDKIRAAAPLQLTEASLQSPHPFQPAAPTFQSPEARLESPDEPYTTIPTRQPNFKLLRYTAAAAIIIAIITFISISTRKKSTPQAPIAQTWLQKTTHPTQKDSITLSDGTIITLNAATTIKFPEHFSDTSREIYLEGEAFFNVNKDPLRPFIIHADKMNIRVLGTSFNVKSYRNEPQVEASLIIGSIEVTLNDRPSDRIILKPKEKLVVQNNRLKISKTDSGSGTSDNNGKNTSYALTNLTYFPNNVKTVVETSWVENKLVFSEKDFIDLSGQLERWYGVHIKFQNDRVKHYNFTGFFEKETLPEALDALKMIEHFDYKIADSTVYIY